MEPREREKVFDIRKRTFDFAVRIIKLCHRLEKTGGVCRVISFQLLKAGTSIGANLEEAAAGQSRADFISKNSISLKEAREVHYWLRLILAANLIPKSDVIEMQAEVEEVKKIIASIVISTKRKPV